MLHGPDAEATQFDEPEQQNAPISHGDRDYEVGLVPSLIRFFAVVPSLKAVASPTGETGR